MGRTARYAIVAYSGKPRILSKTARKLRDRMTKRLRAEIRQARRERRGAPDRQMGLAL